MNTIRIIVAQGVDEKGEPEEFTCDLYPLVDSGELRHLDNNGLPTKGTEIREGMVVVGKTGRGSAFDAQHMPNSLELNGLSREKLLATYPNYWTNTSYYATKETEGTVENACFETVDSKLCAVVEIAPRPKF
jgi:DNA-directed RNA polymerase beta subunit